jgi:hypothetical protein
MLHKYLHDPCAWIEGCTSNQIPLAEIHMYMPWRRRGIMVIASTYGAEDPGFESRQGERFWGLYVPAYVAVRLSKLYMYCHCVYVHTWKKNKWFTFYSYLHTYIGTYEIVLDNWHIWSQWIIWSIAHLIKLTIFCSKTTAGRDGGQDRAVILPRVAIQISLSRRKSSLS